MSLESNNRPQLNLITWIPSSKMVRFLNRNWTRNSLLKSWTVFFDSNFSLAQIYKNRTQANCFRQKHIFLQILLKEKKKTQTSGGDAVPPLWFHPIFPHPTPPPKKSPITTTTKKHPWCFYLIKQKSNNGYLFQSTSNLNGPKTHNHDQQSGSWQININLVMLFYL